MLAFNLSYLFDELDLLHEGVALLEELLAAGRLVLPRITTYPLAEVARAHRDIESAQTIGKLVLVPSSRPVR